MPIYRWLSYTSLCFTTLVVSVGCETMQPTRSSISSTTNSASFLAASQRANRDASLSLFDTAISAKQNQDFETARGSLAVLIKSEPENTSALDMLAEVAQKQGDWQLLRATLRRRARVSPKSATVQNRVGRELIHSVRLERASESQTSRAVADSQLANQTTIRNARVRAVKDGLAAMQRAVDLGPRDTSHVHDLVGALAERGRDEEAVNVIRRALDVNPSDRALPITAARLLEASDDWAGAVFYYDWALRNDPHNRMWNRHRGMCMFHLGNFDRASNDFEVALFGSPVQPQMTEHLAWASSYMQQGQLEQADQLLNRIAAEEGIRNSEVEALRVLCQIQLGNQLNALKILAEVLRSWPNDARLLETERFVHEQLQSNNGLAQAR